MALGSDTETPGRALAPTRRAGRGALAARRWALAGHPLPERSRRHCRSALPRPRRPEAAARGPQQHGRPGRRTGTDAATAGPAQTRAGRTPGRPRTAVPAAARRRGPETAAHGARSPPRGFQGSAAGATPGAADTALRPGGSKRQRPAAPPCRPRPGREHFRAHPRARTPTSDPRPGPGAPPRRPPPARPP